MTVDNVEPNTEILDAHVMRSRIRVGTVLHAKWHLDALLGVGGMAAVYAATHRNGSRAAVKILHPELSVDELIRTRFLREGYAANSVGHEGAVKVIDDDTTEDGAPFLVMELLEGETLAERCLRLGRPLSEPEILSAADQLLDVLVAAHAKGIVHRDVKPENVFLTRRGQVKVLDFGIARVREVPASSPATKSGAAMGTPYYMAPEQARGLWDEVDARTDLWAVGATMFHLLSGVTVHSGRTANEVLLAAMTKPAPLLSSVAPHVSPALARIVDRALSFCREARWSDAEEMLRAVRQARADSPSAGIEPFSPPSSTETAIDKNRRLSEGAQALVRTQSAAPEAIVTTAHAMRAQRSAMSVAAMVLGGAAVLGVAFVGITRMIPAHGRSTRVGAAAPVAPPSTTPALETAPADAVDEASGHIPPLPSESVMTSTAEPPRASAEVSPSRPKPSSARGSARPPARVPESPSPSPSAPVPAVPASATRAAAAAASGVPASPSGSAAPLAPAPSAPAAPALLPSAPPAPSARSLAPSPY